MRGMSTSRMIASGAFWRIRATASYGSAASVTRWPGSASIMARIALRTEALSSTTRMAIGG